MCVTASIASNKIFFAGGSTGGFYQFTNPTLVDDTIDIYDVGTNTWTVRNCLLTQPLHGRIHEQWKSIFCRRFNH